MTTQVLMPGPGEPHVLHILHQNVHDTGSRGPGSGTCALQMATFGVSLLILPSTGLSLHNEQHHWLPYISEYKGNKEPLPIPGSSVAARPGFPGIPEAERKPEEKQVRSFHTWFPINL